MKKIKFIVFTLVFLLIFMYFITPNLIHNYYLSSTSTETIERNKRLYNEITLSISHGEGSFDDLRRSRDSVYLWFHVRGLQIDEDHSGLTKQEEWEELLKYNKRYR
ncbi:MAG: hypothetical protein CMP48_27405 [Rickettsiales bacterium]|nr:hypothetical protein [Rickettsiales bacterium]